MSGGNGRRVSFQDVDMVRHLIERCLQLYMRKREVVHTLSHQAKIEPGFTEVVWQRLEAENPEFFREYNKRLMLMDQIVRFNQLLERQVDLMDHLKSETGVDGSQTHPIERNPVPRDPQPPNVLGIKPENMYSQHIMEVEANMPGHAPSPAHSIPVRGMLNRLASELTGQPLKSDRQDGHSTFDIGFFPAFPVSSPGLNPVPGYYDPALMASLENPNAGITQGFNNIVSADHSPVMFHADNNNAAGQDSISPSSGGESSSQRIEHMNQNWGLSEQTAASSTNTDSYPGSPSVSSNANNLDPQQLSVLKLARFGWDGSDC